MKRMPILGVALVCLTMLPSFAAAQQATPTASPAASSSANCTVGRQADGTIVLPTNQILSPAGDQVEFLGRPNAGAIRPDGKTATFLTAFSDTPLTVVDLASNKAIQTFTPSTGKPDEAYPAASFAGLVYSADGSKLYASDANGAIIIANVDGDGMLTLDNWVQLPKSGAKKDVTARPTGMALAADGKTIYVALNMRNTLGIFDIASKTLAAEIPVGNAPHDVVIAGKTAFVSNEGGRTAGAGDTVNDSGGTKIVSDPRNGGSITGTVSAVDIETAEVTATIAVGLHPTGMTLSGGSLFVTNTNSDTISVIDAASMEVVKTIAVQAFPGAPYGSSPTSAAMIGKDQLVVGLGRNNALALYRWNGPAEPVSFEGLVPTGWNPSQIMVDAARNRLIVVNEKGVGSLGPEASIGPEATNPTGKWVHSNQGSLSLIPFPTEAQMADYTSTVFRDNSWSTSVCSDIQRSAAAVGGETPAPAVIPARIGDPSLIKHVFYIVKENRTYDQVFGDDPRGNGDPNLVQFGEQVTPNQHALAAQFPLLDNFYCSGSLSADGHQWVTQAFAPQYLEQSFGDFNRSYPYNGGDALAYAPTGFLWENALRNDKSVRVYGEYANEERGPDAETGTWADWYKDWLIANGKATGTLHAARGQFTAHSDVPSLDGLLMRDFPSYIGQLIPDQTRADLFLEEFNQYEAQDTLPNLVMMQLVQNHTTGTDPAFPTPAAMVADNDLALGRIVDAITHSKDWASSAIFVVEDDAQGGVDHVDGHRTTAFVISPYAKRAIVDNSYYTQIDMVRTIEDILGLPPMNQMDLAATPMRNAFTETADLTPYNVQANTVPLDEMNPPKSALSGVQLAWADWSSRAGFGDPTTQPDVQDPHLLNRAIWYATRGFDVPYPGDARVLLPSEVPPSDSAGNLESEGATTEP